MRDCYRYIILIVMMVCTLSLQAQSDRGLIRMGNRAFHAQKWTKAEINYRKALAKNSSNSQALYNLGCALLQQDKDSMAVEQFEKASKIENNPFRRSKSYHNIGVIMQKQRQYAQAIDAYKMSLRDNPGDNKTRYNLALCKKLLKNNPNQQNKKNDKNKDKNKNKDKKNQNNKKEDQNQKQNKKGQNQDKNKNQNQRHEQKMSRDNADQLLNAAIQQEKATKQKMQRNMSQPKSRNLDKNW